ncbi:hypothetical protein FLONG3_4781 [Fusarium longipes]|uniref:AB hydrolase-1 domain-containing protein n=1 Tax=Fusarium longipes TaxID=694270 RepID=A0A395SYJ3_9HYPO|nr:hypothetical protein FLONG3_4781 [Fusarium longipes]
MAEQTAPRYEFMRLETKPTAQLSYSFTPPTVSNSSNPTLIVFVNGMMAPQTSWIKTISKLQELSSDGLPAILTFDRFGQGQTTDRDPNDEGASDPTHAHDSMDVVHDIRQLIIQVLKNKLNIEDPDSARLFLVGNSIGCAFSRLYAVEYPGTVSAVLLLDSVVTDTDFVSVFPNPDAEDFKSDSLPSGVSAEDLRVAREETRKRFHPSIGSREGLTRKNLSKLLPKPDSPTLPKADTKDPYVTVLGHDFDYFASRTAADFHTPLQVIDVYMNTYWHHYNEGLAKLTIVGNSDGPTQVPNAGHFIQIDNPDFVAGKAHEILQKLAK